MNLNEPFVITISREIGSGGRTVGRILAKKLDTRYCDKDLVAALQAKFDLSVSGIEKLKAEKKNWLADLIKQFSPFPSVGEMDVDARLNTDFRRDVSSDDIYKAETEILQGLAQEGSCVVAGRSGFHVFKDHPNHLHVFITASKANRIKRVMRKQGLGLETATILVEDIDQGRENYIRRHTGTSRYDARNYDIVLSTDGHTEEQIAQVILSYIGA